MSYSYPSDEDLKKLTSHPTILHIILNGASIIITNMLRNFYQILKKMNLAELKEHLQILIA